eukprot:gene48707-65318_t
MNMVADPAFAELVAPPTWRTVDLISDLHLQAGEPATFEAWQGYLQTTPADALIILTDQRGLFSADPRKDPAAYLIEQGRAGDPALEAMAGGAGSSIGKGGMITKILAAKRAAGSGASTVIAWGREPDALLRLARGESIGTLLVAQTQKKQARKQWMADHLQLRGAVVVDDGAVGKV